MSRAAAGPLREVLTAVQEGASTLLEISARTGCDQDTVAAAIDLLTRHGHLRLGPSPRSCVTTGCSGCPSASPQGCGTGHQYPTGPIPVTLMSRSPSPESPVSHP
ncbi:hypothetical protein KEM60_02477 [Austwickia sp. TVS 96-490-7B]|nr:hypothetical protein [Austwickia sp. TVS 96-490-7B]